LNAVDATRTLLVDI
jgi:hypothetical protein